MNKTSVDFTFNFIPFFHEDFSFRRINIFRNSGRFRSFSRHVSSWLFRMRKWTIGKEKEKEKEEEKDSEKKKKKKKGEEKKGRKIFVGVGKFPTKAHIAC